MYVKLYMPIFLPIRSPTESRSVLRTRLPRALGASTLSAATAAATAEPHPEGDRGSHAAECPSHSSASSASATKSYDNPGKPTLATVSEGYKVVMNLPAEVAAYEIGFGYTTPHPGFERLGHDVDKDAALTTMLIGGIGTKVRIGFVEVEALGIAKSTSKTIYPHKELFGGSAPGCRKNSAEDLAVPVKNPGLPKLEPVAVRLLPERQHVHRPTLTIWLAPAVQSSGGACASAARSGSTPWDLTTMSRSRLVRSCRTARRPSAGTLSSEWTSTRGPRCRTSSRPSSRDRPMSRSAQYAGRRGGQQPRLDDDHRRP